MRDGAPQRGSFRTAKSVGCNLTHSDDCACVPVVRQTARRIKTTSPLTHWRAKHSTESPTCTPRSGDLVVSFSHPSLARNSACAPPNELCVPIEWACRVQCPFHDGKAAAARVCRFPPGARGQAAELAEESKAREPWPRRSPRASSGDPSVGVGLACFCWDWGSVSSRPASRRKGLNPFRSNGRLGKVPPEGPNLLWCHLVSPWAPPRLRGKPVMVFQTGTI